MSDRRESDSGAAEGTVHGTVGRESTRDRVVMLHPPRLRKKRQRFRWKSRKQSAHINQAHQAIKTSQPV
jgi:hypothetical protein